MHGVERFTLQDVDDCRAGEGQKNGLACLNSLNRGHHIVRGVLRAVVIESDDAQVFVLGMLRRALRQRNTWDDLGRIPIVRMH